MWFLQRAPGGETFRKGGYTQKSLEKISERIMPETFSSLPGQKDGDEMERSLPDFPKKDFVTLRKLQFGLLYETNVCVSSLTFGTMWRLFLCKTFFHYVWKIVCYGTPGEGFDWHARQMTMDSRIARVDPSEMMPQRMMVVFEPTDA